MAGRVRDPETREVPSPAAPSRETSFGHRQHSVIQAFNYAFEGLIHVLRRERNMRVHFALAAGVLVLAFAYGVTKLQPIALLLAIAFVLIAEMLNTAIEEMIDLFTDSYDPRAKFAKDVAAGAVLIASVTALVIGYLVLSPRLGEPTYRLVARIRHVPVHLTVIALVLTVIAVIATKAITGRGTPLRGGLPSGHAAVAFGGWMAITFITEEYEQRVLVSSLAFVMALLVAQTRVESRIHSTTEVAVGALLGTLVSMILFQLLA